MRIRLACVVALALTASGASAWVAREPGPAGGPWADVALGPDGNPVVTGWSHVQFSPETAFRVEKLDAADGSVLWSYTASAPGVSMYGAVVEVDTAGDVVAGAVVVEGSAAIVVKLSGVDGSVVWRRDLDGPGAHLFVDMSLESNGDVALVTNDGPDEYSTSGVVRRLAAATGADAWTTTLDPGKLVDVTLDAAGDVAVGGILSNTTVVAKVDGATGAELWRVAPPSTTIVERVAVDASGDVLASGYLLDLTPPVTIRGAVTKASGVDGTNAWQWLLAPTQAYPSLVLGPDPSGDVYVTGSGDDGVVVARLAGASGAELWLNEVSGKNAYGRAVVVSPGGVPTVAATVDGRFTVAAFSPPTGERLWMEQLPGTFAYGGFAYDLAFGGGYLFAAGSTVVIPPASKDDPLHQATLARWIDPSAPPVVGTCTPAPRTDCRESVQPLRSALAVRDVPGTRRDTLKWKLAGGAATTLSELDDPTTPGADWTLCLYDATATRIFSLAIPSGGACGGAPCWRAAGTKGYSFKSARPREPEGVDKLKLGAGLDGAVKVNLARKGRDGIDLAMPPVAALTPPLTVQLQRDGGICFGADFAPAGVVKQDAFTLKARGD